MTTTEKKYSAHIGSLYNYNYQVYWHAAKNIDMIVMPILLDQRGGWWHYKLQVISNHDGILKDYMLDNMFVVCKQFLRQATEIKDAA